MFIFVVLHFKQLEKEQAENGEERSLPPTYPPPPHTPRNDKLIKRWWQPCGGSGCALFAKDKAVERRALQGAVVTRRLSRRTGSTNARVHAATTTRQLGNG